MPPEYGVRFRLTLRKNRNISPPGGMNASPTVFFRRFQNRPTNTNLSAPQKPAGQLSTSFINSRTELSPSGSSRVKVAPGHISRAISSSSRMGMVP